MDKRFHVDIKPRERIGQMSGSIPQSGRDNYLSVSRARDAVHIQVVGFGNMFLAPTLQSFVTAELKNGLRNFIIDMQRCDGMDSTFMGTFIGLAVKVQEHQGWFCLVNVSTDNLRLLKMLGALHMLSIHDREFPVPPGKATTLYPTRDPQVRQKQIYDAHRLLISADPENEKLFGPFIKALEAELYGSAPDLENADAFRTGSGDDTSTEEGKEVPTILPPSEPNDA